MLDSIERNFDLTKDRVVEAKKEIKQAAAYAVKARKVRCEQNYSFPLLYLLTFL